MDKPDCSNDEKEVKNKDSLKNLALNTNKAGMEGMLWNNGIIIFLFRKVNNVLVSVDQDLVLQSTSTARFEY